MSSAGREIADCKMNAYAKFHIPTKDEVMEDIIEIGKALVNQRIQPNSKGDVLAVFVEYGNGKYGFNGFIGDHIQRLDINGNLLHIGDIIEITLKDGQTIRQVVLNIQPRKSAIALCNVKLVQSYKEIKVNYDFQSSIPINIISCALEYLKFNNPLEESKTQEMTL